MSLHFRQLPPREQWYWSGMRIRLGLHTDEPRLFDHYEAVGAWLHEHGLVTPWSVADRFARLLLDTAEDASLPPHWRMLCLDRLHGPLEHLACLRATEADCRHVEALRRRLARIECPSAEEPPPAAD
ncbi:MAG: hypothetical protein REI09_13895 [Candidatus Dactylopiibacterium sp.]|nr:hypothetical protein [Candidatus Dactylopiibacterium sp.]